MTIFDHLTNVTVGKKDWKMLDETDRKSWSSYMINRLLSMEIDYIETVAELQKYTIGNMPNDMVHRLYIELLPRQKVWNKYIKDENREKRTDVLKILCEHFGLGQRETDAYLSMLEETETGRQELQEILTSYGYEPESTTKKKKKNG